MTYLCRDCRFFHTEGGQSSCRAAPPKVDYNREDGSTITLFPMPSPLAWCGFHKIAWGRLIHRLFVGNGT